MARITSLTTDNNKDLFLEQTDVRDRKGLTKIFLKYEPVVSVFHLIGKDNHKLDTTTSLL